MKYYFWMASLYKLHCNKRRQICQLLGDAKAFYDLSEKQRRSLHLFDDDELAYIEASKKSASIERQWADFQKTKIRFLPYNNAAYPQKLLQIFDPPFALYVKGELPDPQKKSVAIVGARSCSEYGRSIAYKLGKELAISHAQVISGMAMGIDSASHAGALSQQGDTFAVLGNGCDICYPKSSRNIYENILASQGGILSEFAPGTQPQPFFFPQRNRIISGLSDVVVIVEAKKKSGSLITADFALEQGRDIFAVPGRYQDTLSEGCNALIAQGAGILHDITLFLKTIGVLEEAPKKKSPTKDALWAKEETLVYHCLDLHPKFINTIVDETHLNLLSTLHALDCLKKRHLVQETFQNYFCRQL